MNTREEFEKWCKENTDLQNYYVDPSGQYANDQVLYAFMAWQKVTERKQAVIDAMADKIDELILKLDIKDDAICALNLALDHAIEENKQLRDSQENTVKMLKSVMQMLDYKLHL